jgi:hypothetical protein
MYARCADFRPEPAIVTTRCASFDFDRHQQSQHHQLDKMTFVTLLTVLLLL